MRGAGATTAVDEDSGWIVPPSEGGAALFASDGEDENEGDVDSIAIHGGLMGMIEVGGEVFTTSSGGSEDTSIPGLECIEGIANGGATIEGLAAAAAAAAIAAVLPGHQQQAAAVVRIASCPVCQRVFRPRTLVGSALQSVAAHLKAKARAGCAAHAEVRAATLGGQARPKCPCCPGGTGFATATTAWAHIAAAVDEDHQRLHMDDVRIPQPNRPRRRGGNRGATTAAITPAQRQAQQLYAAAKGGDAATVKQMLSKGVSPDDGGEDGFTPLMTATEAGHVGIVALLLEADSDVNLHNRRVRAPSHYALADAYGDAYACACAAYYTQRANTLLLP